jgi:hypothetical protein
MRGGARPTISDDRRFALSFCGRQNSRFDVQGLLRSI